MSPPGSLVGGEKPRIDEQSRTDDGQGRDVISPVEPEIQVHAGTGVSARKEGAKAKTVHNVSLRHRVRHTWGGVLTGTPGRSVRGHPGDQDQHLEQGVDASFL